MRSLLSAFFVLMIGLDASAQPALLSCHMNQCSWVDIKTLEVINDGQDGGRLYEVSFFWGYSGHGNPRTSSVDYPNSYSPDIDIEWKEPGNIMVYCSRIRPTVFEKGQTITTFEFPNVYGFQMSYYMIYTQICHGSTNIHTDEALENLGYGNLRRKEFNSIEKMLTGQLIQTKEQRNIYYKVVGVQSDEVLNIRSEPTSSSEIIGSIAHNNTLVETTAQDGKWVRVNTSERNGWIHSTYLEPIKLQTIPETNLPVGLSCFGEEPYWYVKIDGDKLSYRSNRFDYLSRREYRITSITSVDNSFQITGQAISDQWTQTIGDSIIFTITDEHAQSSMADTDYNWSVLLYESEYDRPWSFTGLCTLS
jgi:hypothetical protein